MNWTQYFQLGEKRKDWFKKTFYVILFLNIIFLRDSLFHGEDTYCGVVESDCNQTDENQSLINIINISDVMINEAVLDDVFGDTFNLSINATNETNTSLLDKVFRISYGIGKSSLDYAWVGCEFNCSDVGFQVKAKVTGFRFLLTPLIVVVDIILALIIVQGIYLFKLHKLENAAPAEKEGDGGEKKEEKK